MLEEENGERRVSGWMILEVLGVQPNFRRKSLFDGEVLHKATTQNEKLVPYLVEVGRRSSIQFNFFNHLKGGTSGLAEKHLSVGELHFF